jgi:hypothetical protein
VSTDAMQQLHALQARAQRLAANVDDVERQQREAQATLRLTSEALAEVERRELTGQAVSDSERRKAESALARARGAVEQPWVERRAGAHRAADDAQGDVRRYVAEHLDELVASVEQQGAAAATDMLAACEALVATYERRQAAERQIGQLASHVGRVLPGDVGPATNAERLISEAHALLAAGEPGPTLRRRPDQPRHAAALPEAIGA